MVYDPAAPGMFKRIVAALKLRCPRCCKGAVWRGPFRMQAECPVCALVYEREPGYFTGAMYASYFIGIFLTLPVWLAMLISGAALAPILVVAIGMVVALTPASFHYSRVFWMHVDCYVNPKTFESAEGS